MVESKSTSRLSRLEDKVILAQTDTTVGFASQNHDKLAQIKERPPTKKFLQVFSSFHAFTQRRRVPQKFKKIFRRSRKTTFIINDKAARINKDILHSQTMRDLPYYYSTSANEKGGNFDWDFCESKADIIIEDKDGLRELTSSKLIKINKKKQVRLR